MNKGQTKQHIDIIKGMGISQLIVVLNKMDRCNWSESSFKYILNHLNSLFAQDSFFKSHYQNFKYVPISAYEGDNLLYNKELSYYKGASLIKTLKEWPIEVSHHKNGMEKPIRLTIKNVYKNSKGIIKGKILEVKVEGGTIQTGTRLKVMPGGILFDIRNMYINSKAIKTAQFGDIVDIVLHMDKDTEFEELKAGNISKTT